MRAALLNPTKRAKSKCKTFYSHAEFHNAFFTTSMHFSVWWPFFLFYVKNDFVFCKRIASTKKESVAPLNKCTWETL